MKKVNEEEYEEYDENEDATGFLDPKVEKVVGVVGIALAIVIVIIVAFLGGNIISNMLNFGGGTNTESQQSEETESESESESETQKIQEVKMISLTGKTLEEAEDALKKMGLELNIAAYRDSDTAEANTILEQSAKEGTMVEKGSTISVVVAGTNSNVEKIEVPDVVGRNEADAYNKLTAKGFLVTREYEISDTVEEGKVISQTPDGDTKASKGTRVTIVISQGGEKKIVPANLIGKSVSEAQSELEELGFIVDIVQQYNTQQPNGTVFKVEGAGTEKEVGTTLKLYISLGEEPSSEEPSESESESESSSESESQAPSESESDSQSESESEEGVAPIQEGNPAEDGGFSYSSEEA